MKSEGCGLCLHPHAPSCILGLLSSYGTLCSLSATHTGFLPLRLRFVSCRRCLEVKKILCKIDVCPFLLYSVVINHVVKQNHIGFIMLILLSSTEQRTYGDLILVIAPADKLRTPHSQVSKETHSLVASSAQVQCSNFSAFCWKVLSHSLVSHDTNTECTRYSLLFPLESNKSFTVLSA